jgi:hypothetical protein
MEAPAVQNKDLTDSKKRVATSPASRRLHSGSQRRKCGMSELGWQMSRGGEAVIRGAASERRIVNNAVLWVRCLG